jgi:hypothetical protein
VIEISSNLAAVSRRRTTVIAITAALIAWCALAHINSLAQSML